MAIVGHSILTGNTFDGEMSETAEKALTCMMVQIVSFLLTLLASLALNFAVFDAHCNE